MSLMVAVSTRMKIKFWCRWVGNWNKVSLKVCVLSMDRIQILKAPSFSLRWTLIVRSYKFIPCCCVQILSLVKFCSQNVPLLQSAKFVANHERNSEIESRRTAGIAWQRVWPVATSPQRYLFINMSRLRFFVMLNGTSRVESENVAHWSHFDDRHGWLQTLQ